MQSINNNVTCIPSLASAMQSKLTCQPRLRGHLPNSYRKHSNGKSFHSKPQNHIRYLPIAHSNADARTVGAPSAGQPISAADAQVATPTTSPNRRHVLSSLGLSAGCAGLGALIDAASALVLPSPALAALKDYNLDPNAPIEEVEVQLGTEDGQLVFVPDKLEFTAGRITKLKLRNPSASTHYFTPFEFAEKVFTIMVLAGDPAVEVKGGIQEVALKAGASATWIFIPLKPGTYPVRCTVKGHDAMRGQLVVRRAA